MEVVSTSNLVSSETKKTTTACNFQHDYAMRSKQKATHIYKYEAICSFMMAEIRKSTLRNTYTQNSKIKTDQQKVEEIFYNNLIRAKEVFRVEQ